MKDVREDSKDRNTPYIDFKIMQEYLEIQPKVLLIFLILKPKFHLLITESTLLSTSS